VSVLAVDADREVAQAGHDARETTNMDLGVVLAGRAVPDVVQKTGAEDFRCAEQRTTWRAWRASG